MARQKGEAKTGGRKAGTPNKFTKVNRDLIQKFIDDKWPDAVKAWENIDNPKEQFAQFVKLLEFIMPKMASVEMKADGKTPDWMLRLEELRGKK